MGIVGSYQYPTMESVIYGKPAAEALREEEERLGAKRVYLIVSRTLNTTTDEIEKIRKALGDRHAEGLGSRRSRPASVAPSAATSAAWWSEPIRYSVGWSGGPEGCWRSGVF